MRNRVELARIWNVSVRYCVLVDEMDLAKGIVGEFSGHRPLAGEVEENGKQLNI
jgi:hypothetical protein